MHHSEPESISDAVYNPAANPRGRVGPLLFSAMDYDFEGTLNTRDLFFGLALLLSVSEKERLRCGLNLLLILPQILILIVTLLTAPNCDPGIHTGPYRKSTCTSSPGADHDTQVHVHLDEANQRRIRGGHSMSPSMTLAPTLIRTRTPALAP